MKNTTIKVDDMIQYIRNYPNQKLLMPENTFLTQKQREIKITTMNPMDHSLMDRYFKIFIKKYKKYIVMDSNTTTNLSDYGKNYWNQMLNTQKSNTIKNIHQTLLNSRKQVIIIPWPTNVEFKKQWPLLVVQ